MAKKVGKFLLFTAALGAVGAACYYYMQKKDAELLADLDEDFDDFSEDEEDAPARNYVPLTIEEPAGQAPADEVPADEVPEEATTFTPLTETISVTPDADEQIESSEDFFDDEENE